VAFVAGVLEEAILGIQRQGKGYAPRPRVDLRIVDRRRVGNLAFRNAAEALDHAQAAGVSDALDPAAGHARRDPSEVVEVRRLDDQRVAFPSSTRIAVPEADAIVRRGAAVERNDPRVVNHLVMNHDEAGEWHDL